MIASRNRVNGINRVFALVIALVWLAAGVTGLLLGISYSRWLLVGCAFFAIGYAFLWLRVVVRARLLAWHELIAPWRVPGDIPRLPR
jgi:hypothetical protein